MAAKKQTTEFSYDVVPYPSHAFPQTHPDRLATLARLFGMQPADIQQCRILELGCADGNNLLPMAANLTNSEFIGVDLSKEAITKGQAIIDGTKLSNIQLLHQDINSLDDSIGKFDYIIVHGLFSWVDEKTQNKIFQLCQQTLQDHGVAFISYNTYPGWHMRGMLRDMMIYHTRDFSEPKQQIEQARTFINFLANSVPTENNAYGMLLKDELEKMKTWDDNYLYHDSLETINEPLYFYQFIESAQQAGLQFLSEIEFSAMLAGNFPPEVKKTLEELGKNIIAMEQYMDFLRNRMFRQTLLCRQEVKLSRNINANMLKDFYFAAPIKPASENLDLTGDTKEVFTFGNKTKLTAHVPLSKTTWSILADIWPHPVSFDTLLMSVNTRLDIDDEQEQQQNADRLADILLQTYIKGLINVDTYPPHFSLVANDLPLASPIARWQAQHEQTVTNQRHEMLRLDRINAFLLSLLDGKHHRLKLEEMLEQAVTDGDIKLDKDITDQENYIHQLVNTRLNALAKLALIIQ